MAMSAKNGAGAGDAGASGKPEYVAHTPDPSDPTERWQCLEEHLVGVAEAAARFAEPFGAGALAHRAGLLHDVGKYSDEFQGYLRECDRARRVGSPPPRKGIDHKSAGARLARADRRGGAGELLAYALFGHHGGLPARAELQQALHAAVNPSSDRAIARALALLPALAAPPPEARTVPALSGSVTDTDVELFTRLLFSCLVDADFLDTEAHFRAGELLGRARRPAPGVRTPVCTERNPPSWVWEGPRPRTTDTVSDTASEERTAPPSRMGLAAMRDRLLQDQARLQVKAPDTAVNRARREIFTACQAAAQRAPGVFRLTAPTGGGKTRASLMFALEHAARHGLERVIYAIPYTSIIDQTAGVFRGILGDDAPLLEHHSAVPEPAEGDDAAMETERWRRLASENWDAPLIVTTTVQLFESLFARSPSRCRKLHQLARSVLVLDEAQTLPLPLLAPILDALKTLVAGYRMTVVLCTATQPALEINSPYLSGFAGVVDIIEGAERHFRALCRVKYEVREEPLGWDAAAAELRASDQCLAVVNTRKDALALLAALDDPQALHLSTLLCGAHRRAVLEEVRRRLDAGEACRLLSTQVIEAGVDVDFPLVLRAIGPFDRIIQAAGRCNREGKLAAGRIVVFFPKAGSTPLGAYRTALDEAKLLLRSGPVDFDDPAVCERYFRRLYQGVDTDAYKIQQDRRDRHYPEVARKFRMIAEETIPVLVPYAPCLEEFDALLAWARGGPLTRSFWRQAQPLIVSLYRRDFETAYRAGVIEEVVPEQFFVWRGLYDPVLGLADAARAARDPADWIV